MIVFTTEKAPFESLSFSSLGVVVRAFRADSMNDILNGLNLESFGYMYLGDSLVFQAKGFSANGASEVHMLAQFVMMGALSIETNVLASGLLTFFVAMGMFETDAILLFARSIIEGVHQVVFDEKGQGLIPS
jgi:hypothetical protein